MNAKEYRKLAAKKQSETAVHDVTLPSGAVWKLKEPPIQQFILAGKLPVSLTAKLTEVAKQHQGNAAAAHKAMLEKMSPEDFFSNLELARDLLLHCAIDPKIVVNANPDSETEIAPEDILPGDWEFLVSWVMTGGKSGESLSTFRPE